MRLHPKPTAGTTDDVMSATHPVFRSQLDVELFNQLFCFLLLEVHDGIKDL